MNKKMREIKAKIQQKTAEAKTYMVDGENKNTAKAEELLNEIDDLKKDYALEERIFNAEKEAGVPDEEEREEKKNVSALEKFGQDAKKGFALDKSLNEGTAVDGGYTVPEDIVTRVEKYRESKASLLNLVTVVKVKTNKGQRTFKTRAQQTGFTKVGEGGKIGAKATPKFERVNYVIEKYAGYFPVTNEVLADSDAALGQILVEWIGDESRVTANKLILEQIAAKDAVDLADLDGIKKAINVTLGQAYKGNIKIVTNDDGLQYLDTLKDGNERYLLAPMPGDVMSMTLAVGAQRIPVVVIPNADMPSGIVYGATADVALVADKTYYTRSGSAGAYVYTAVKTPDVDDIATYYEVVANRIPLIIGDLKEGIVYWDRKQMNIKISDVAVVGQLNAYEEDLTLYRAIEREDVTQRDANAFVNGYITVTEGE